jgi:hypothetical protein
MVRLFWLLVLVYVIGIGVKLAPTVRDSWSTLPASQLVSRLAGELPDAAAWPMRVYESLRGLGASTPAGTPAPNGAPAPATPPASGNAY